MSDELPEEGKTCEEGHSYTSTCKTCGYTCCNICKDIHIRNTSHKEFKPIRNEIKEKKSQVAILQKQIEECTIKANKELLVSRNILQGGYSLGLIAIKSLRAQLNSYMDIETKLQAELVNAITSVSQYKEVLKSFSDESEKKMEEVEGERVEEMTDEHEDKLKEIGNEIAKMQTLIDNIHNSSYSFMAAIMQLVTTAPQEINIAHHKEPTESIGGSMGNLLNLKAEMEKEMSVISGEQNKLDNRLKALEDKIEVVKEGSMKDRLCSLCKKQEECLHKLDCKHKICASCVKELVADQITKQRKILVKCWKCGNESNNIKVELSCGCSEDLLSKRSQIIEATHGEIFFYNSVTLECKNPNCKNHHEMKDEDLLLFYTEGALKEELSTITELKRKDGMTSLRKEMEGLINEPNVDLSGKLIRDEEAKLVADFIKINGKLKTLNLNGNELKDEGLVMIAEALRRHNAIILLDLRGNKFTELGKNYLEDVNNDKGRQLKIMYYYITIYLIYPQGR